MRPPGRERASRTTTSTGTGERRSSAAQERPATPAPTTMTRRGGKEVGIWEWMDTVESEIQQSEEVV